jgi:uncharacterized protein (TIGR04255 family)
VYLTLAQVRFNTILTLVDFLPGIQESFRLAGYPDFERQQLMTIHVSLQDGKATPKPVPQEIFKFGNVEKTHLFILDGQSLTLQSTNYGQFETFSECFAKGLKIVQQALSLAFTERVGLRYLDRVMPQEGETIEQYLTSQVHGLASHLGGKPLYSFAESLNEVGNIKLVSRVAIQEGPLSFPADLQQSNNMAFAERFTSYTGQNAILDNDGFVEGREPFSVTAVLAYLDAIHKVIGDAFKVTATKHAFLAWDK